MSKYNEPPGWNGSSHWLEREEVRKYILAGHSADFAFVLRGERATHRILEYQLNTMFGCF